MPSPSAVISGSGASSWPPRSSSISSATASLASPAAMPSATATGRCPSASPSPAAPTDGTLEIIDFKPGSIPPPASMKSFEAPQLLLEAAMGRAGAFAPVPPAPSSALTYVKIGLGPQALEQTDFRLRDGLDLDGAVDEVSTRLAGHVEALLLRDNLPMAARIRPDLGRRYRGDYDHLARTDEWTISAGDDSP